MHYVNRGCGEPMGRRGDEHMGWFVVPISCCWNVNKKRQQTSIARGGRASAGNEAFQL